jgi:(1->4)-alpha-D-glucan 1-alpha-D-glucosylmutase
MLYQTLVGAWPARLDAGDEIEVARFTERVARWQEKALREAKVRSDWAEPDAEYEGACRDFLEGMLADPLLREGLAGFAARIGPAGAINGLAQTILRLTIPGVPDLYQGCEFWDESLVDPDNRRPVDFPTRREAFARASFIPDLLRSWRSGHVKQALIVRLLSLRANFPRLFAAGSYEAIEAAGAQSRHVLAFLRSDGATRLIVAVARLSVKLLGSAAEPVIDPAAWEDTELQVPVPLTGPWHNVLVPDDVLEIGRCLPAAAVFRGLPVACWLGGDQANGLRT